MGGEEEKIEEEEEESVGENILFPLGEKEAREGEEFYWE